MSLREQAERVYDIAIQDGRRRIGVKMLESALNKSLSRAWGRAMGSKGETYRMVISEKQVS